MPHLENTNTWATLLRSWRAQRRAELWLDEGSGGGWAQAGRHSLAEALLSRLSTLA